jgi:hypothetical protein
MVIYASVHLLQSYQEPGNSSVVLYPPDFLDFITQEDMMSLVAPLAQIYALEYDGEGKPFSSRSGLYH